MQEEGYVVARSLNFDTSCRCVVKFTLQPFYFLGKYSTYRLESVEIELIKSNLSVLNSRTGKKRIFQLNLVQAGFALKVVRWIEF